MEGDQVYEVEEEKIMWQQLSESGQGEMKVRRERKRVREEDMAAGPKKKRLSSEQVRLLEMNFGREQKLEAARKDRLATQLGLAPRQVAVWFQNRRVRWKCRQMEEECVKLKKMHDLVLDDKCQLEDQVLKLREQLSEAHRELRKLSNECYGKATELRKLSNECYGKATATSVGERNHSPNSLLFMEGLANHHHHHSHYHHPNTLTGIEGCGDDHSLFCAPESECHCHSYLKGLDEWTYMYMSQ